MSHLENPRFTERTYTNLGRPHRLPHVCTKTVYGKLGGYRWQENLMIYLTPERRLCFFLGSGIFAAGLWAIWRGAAGRGALQISFSPPARWGSMDWNPAPHHATLSFQLPRHGQPEATSIRPLFSELSSSTGLQTRMLWRLPAFWAPMGTLWQACQLSGPKECQIECQSICLSVYLPTSSIYPSS